MGSDNSTEIALRIGGDSAAGQAAVQQMADSFHGLGGTAHELSTALTEAFENPMGALRSLGSEIEHALGPLGALAGLAVVAVGGMTAAVLELGEKGAEIADVQHGFERFAGSVEQANSILGALRDGVRGTISDFALTKDALHLMSAGVELTAGDFGTLTEASLVLAHEGFGTTTEILDRLTQAMITGRTRIVERMTGVLDSKDAEETYAESLGVSVDRLTKAGQVEAKRQEILERLRQVVEDAGEQELSFKDRLDQMHTSMTNANDALSVAIATSPVLAQVLKSVGDAIGDAFGANQVQTIQTLVHGIDQGAITLVSFGQAGLTAAEYIAHAWSGMQVAVSGSLSLITEAGLLTMRAYEAAANLSAAITTGAKSTFYADEARQAKELGDQLQAMQKSFHDDASAALAAAAGHTAFDDKIAKGQTVLDELRSRMIEASKTNVDATAIINALGDAHTRTAAKVKAAADEMINIFGGAITINGSVETSYQDLSFKVDNFGSSLDETNRSAKAYLQDSRDAIQDAVDNWGNLISTQNEFHDGVTVAGDTIATVTIPLFSSLAREILPQMSGAIHDATKETASFSDELSGSLDDALRSMPNLLVKAFTGGGGLSGAVSALGSKFGADLGKEILGKEGEGGVADTLTSHFGDAIGGALGAAIPAVGALIGPLIGKLFSIGGPSEAELAGRKTEAAFEQGLGGIAGIGKALTDAGLSADEANAHIQALFASEKSGSAAVQTQISAINTIIQQHATDVSTSVQGILDAAKTVGTNFPAALQPMIAQLIALPGLTDAEKNSLLGLSNAGQPSFNDLSQAAGRYGLTLDTIGGKAAQLSISTEADQIESDYKTLVTTSGADSDKVLAGMKDSLTKLVNHALDAGDVLPTALKPLVDQLFNTGQLTDDAGNKITDLSKLKFDDTGDPLAKGMQSLTDAINHLGELLDPTSPKGLPAIANAGAAAIGNALGGIKAPEIDLHYRYIADNTTPDWGGAQAAGGIGRVTRPTLFLAGEAGDEDVAFSGGGKRFSGLGLGGGGGVTIQVDASGSIFRDRASMQELARAIADAHMDSVRQVTQMNRRT